MRTTFLRDDGHIDMVAVEKAAFGQAGCDLTRREAQLAANKIVRNGGDRAEIQERCGCGEHAAQRLYREARQAALAEGVQLPPKAERFYM